MPRKHVFTNICVISLVIALTTVGWAQDKTAENAAQFYKGKRVSIYIGYSAGGGYDTYARLLARHLGENIPGSPAVVPQNMPGAGSLRLANWLFNVAPKDGTVIGAVSRGAPFEPLLTGEGTQFDAARFNWIGSMNNEGSVCVTWAETGIKEFADLQRREVIMAANRADTDQFPRILNEVFNTRIKLVLGYPGGSEMNLAMERGEVQGRCGWSWSSVVMTKPGWLKDKKINVIVQMALRKHSDLPDIPLAIDLTEKPEEKSLLRLILARQTTGRPIVAPPGVPSERVQALRDAFMTTMGNRDFINEAAKAQLEIEAVPGLEVQDLVTEAYATPQPLVERARKALKE